MNCIAFVFFSACAQAETNLRYNHDNPQLEFAADAIRAELDDEDLQASLVMDSSLSERAESFSIEVEGDNRVRVTGVDAAGAMYGGLELAVYRENGNPEYREKAVSELTEAAHRWKQYTAAALEHIENPLWCNRIGYCDWKKLTTEVEKDIEIAKQ